MRTPSCVLWCLLLAGCGGGRGDDDDDSADGDADADSDGDADGDADGDSDGDGDADSDADADACVPDAGGAVLDGYCDQAEVALLEVGGETRVVVSGRMFFGAEEGICAVVDAVDVTRGTDVVQTLDGAPGALGLDFSEGLLAEGMASAELTARCGTDDPWADSYGIVVRGHVDGGTYEARCGSADTGGSGWPPRVALTCHEGLDRPPGAGNAMVGGGEGFVWTDLYAYFGHEGSAAIIAIDPTVRILPAFAPFDFGESVAPFDTTWSASVSESDFPGTGATSQVSLHADGDPLGSRVCPITPPMPDPLEPPPPVFIARVTGTTETGAFTSEIVVDMCTRPAPVQ